MSAATVGSQTVPVPTQVTQETNNTAGGVVRPVQHNKSYSGGRNRLDINSATTTTATASASNTVERVCVVSVTGGTMGQIDIYDNTSASGTKVYSNPTPTQGLVVTLNIPLFTGLTVVTAAATLVSVSYE